MTLPYPIPPAPILASPPDRKAALREASIQLEAAFLSEMLQSAGMGESRTGFGGGAGEDQFSSFLVREQALAMTRAGGIGLSESIFNALKERSDAQ